MVKMQYFIPDPLFAFLLEVSPAEHLVFWVSKRSFPSAGCLNIYLPCPSHLTILQTGEGNIYPAADWKMLCLSE